MVRECARNEGLGVDAHVTSPITRYIFMHTGDERAATQSEKSESRPWRMNRC